MREHETAAGSQTLPHRELVLAFVIYEIVNLLFVAKYVPRAGIDPVLVSLIHVVGLTAGLFLCLRVSSTWKRLLSCTIALSILVGIVGIMIRVDPLSVKADRWSALAHWLSAALSGDYPYAVRTHLDPGNPPSPFPVMQALALPFYLLGDVGYLNLAVFAGLIALSYLHRWSDASRAVAVLLYIAAPALWWEQAVRSDLAGNFFIVCFFLLIYDRRFGRQTITRPVLAGALVGLLLSTRAIVLLPLGIYFLNPFLGSSRRQRLLFVVAVAVAFCATFVPLFVFWDAALVLEHNPFVLQSNKASTVVKLVGICLCLVLAWRTRTVGQALINSAIVMFVLMSGAMLDTSVKHGWNGALHESHFDISYFTTAIPFVICSTPFFRETQTDALKQVTDF